MTLPLCLSVYGSIRDDDRASRYRPACVMGAEVLHNYTEIKAVTTAL